MKEADVKSRVADSQHLHSKNSGLPTRSGSHERHRFSLYRSIISRRVITQFYHHGSRVGINVDVLSLQANRGKSVAAAHRPPLQAVAAARLIFIAGGLGRLADPVFRHDAVAIGF